ncbi:hypothetical protein ACFR97_12195 [Haloplanus litoreus]|uniref:Transposase DDE domain-containing protein n=1 Tax=Haloplanus litoreus TaxID=767515 RepID=A0ABD5ZZF2_9EURY
MPPELAWFVVSDYYDPDSCRIRSQGEFLQGCLSMAFVTRVGTSLGYKRVMLEVSLSVRFNLCLTADSTEIIESGAKRCVPVWSCLLGAY